MAMIPFSFLVFTVTIEILKKASMHARRKTKLGFVPPFPNLFRLGGVQR